MLEISELVGQDNMKPEAKEAVMTLLRGLQQPNSVKRFLFSRWSRLVGSVATSEELNSVAPLTQD